MRQDFQNLAEQEQLSYLATKDAAFERALALQNEKARELGLGWKQESAATYIDSDEDVPQYLASTLQDADEESMAKMRAYKPYAEARWAAIDELIETRYALRSSEFETVREAAWADVDEKIGNIETGRFRGEYLQNVLYALSVGPFASSGQQGDLRIRLQTGDFENYNLPDLLDTHWLINKSQGIYGEFGERRNMLSERGQEVLDRLTMKHGQPEWAHKVEPQAPQNANDGGGHLG